MELDIEGVFTHNRIRLSKVKMKSQRVIAMQLLHQRRLPKRMQRVRSILHVVRRSTSRFKQVFFLIKSSIQSFKHAVVQLTADSCKRVHSIQCITRRPVAGQPVDGDRTSSAEAVADYPVQKRVKALILSHTPRRRNAGAGQLVGSGKL